MGEGGRHWGRGRLGVGAGTGGGVRHWGRGQALGEGAGIEGGAGSGGGGRQWAVLPGT